MKNNSITWWQRVRLFFIKKQYAKTPDGTAVLIYKIDKGVLYIIGFIY